MEFLSQLLAVFLIVAQITGTHSDIVVTVPEKVVGNLGDTVTLPCNFKMDPEAVNKDTIFMKWKDGDLTRYAYYAAVDDADGAVRTPPDFQDEDMERYTRSNYSLVISDFRVKDSGERCCDIQYEQQYGAACVQVDWTDFPASALQCVDAEGNALENHALIVKTAEDNILQVNCSYSNVTPRSDLMLYEEGNKEPLQLVDKADATEQNDRFSLDIVINRLVTTSTTFTIAAEGENLTREFVLKIQYAGSSTNEPKQRRAMVGAIVGTVVVVVIVILVALAFGYFRGKQRQDFIDDNTEKAGAPHDEELVEKPQHKHNKIHSEEKDKALLADSNGGGDPTFEVHA